MFACELSFPQTQTTATKLLALKGRGAKLVSVTQESTVQDYRSEQMASSLFFSLGIMLGFISNPPEEISFNFSSINKNGKGSEVKLLGEQFQ